MSSFEFLKIEIQYSCPGLEDSMPPPVCCRCNASGRCKKCSCTKLNKECSNCLPLRRGHCHNTVFPVMEADHATGPASPTEYVTTELVPTEPVPMPATEPSALLVFVSAELTLMNEPAMVPGPMESVPFFNFFIYFFIYKSLC